MFKINYDEVKEMNGVIEKGNYEVFISKAEMSISKSGREHIQLWFTVRNDIKQKYQNVIVFDRLWKSKENDEFQMWQIQAISKACKLENGKNYQSVLQWLEDLKNKTLIIKVGHQEYNNEIQAIVKAYMESDNNKLLHQSKEPKQEGTFIVVDTEDTPF